MTEPTQSFDYDETSAEDTRRPKIVNHYLNFKPPFPIDQIVADMVKAMPAEYVRGLSQIVLTNVSAQSRAARRAVTRSRGRKVKRIEALGLYHPAHGNQSAWIEIFVDNTFRKWDRGLWLHFRFLRISLVGDVFFHELGHHIHFTVRPEFNEREDVADKWKARLQRKYMQTRFPALHWLLTAINFLSFGLIQWIKKRLSTFLFKRGWISRAELKEIGK